MAEEFKRLKRTLVQKGAIIDYYQDTIAVSNGNIVTFDFIGHQGAAATLPVRDDGKILMVRQFRNALDRYTLEIPAGGLNGPNEPTKEAAARELEEETGYKAERLEMLLSIYTTVAFCNEKIDIYLATGLKPGQQHLDEDEFIGVQAFELEELTNLIYQGKIQDAKTISAIMTYKGMVTDKDI